MLRKGHILAILVIVVSVATITSISAQEPQIPSWIKTTVGFWISGDASDAEFINTIQWLLENKIIYISDTENKNQQQQIELLEKQRDDYKKQLDELWVKHVRLEEQLEGNSYDSYQPSYDPAPTSGRIQSQECEGYAECFSGMVTEVIDGDTIKVEGQSIRFALVDTPEAGDYGYGQATNFIKAICPVGSIALVDEDDLQTQGSFSRIIAVVYCNGMNLNKAVLDQGYAILDTYFCSKSEFEYHSWAQVHGCAYEEPAYEEPKYLPPTYEEPEYVPPAYEEPEYESTPTPNCDPSYPDFCIPSPPPDLNCSDIPQKRFTVLQPDPHRFDGDKDGIGCES